MGFWPVRKYFDLGLDKLWTNAAKLAAAQGRSSSTRTGSMAFNAMWKPGPDAAAGMHVNGNTSEPALVIYLDPDSLAIMPPHDQEQWPEFIRLMHELASAATEVADRLRASPTFR